MKMKVELTKGPIFQKLILFSMPMIAGNLLQQIYNLVDIFVVGRYISADALAAVGSSYTLMIFITSIIIGLCMGHGYCTGCIGTGYYIVFGYDTSCTEVGKRQHSMELGPIERNYCI